MMEDDGNAEMDDARTKQFCDINEIIIWSFCHCNLLASIDSFELKIFRTYITSFNVNVN